MDETILINNFPFKKKTCFEQISFLTWQINLLTLLARIIFSRKFTVHIFKKQLTMIRTYQNLSLLNSFHHMTSRLGVK